MPLSSREQFRQVVFTRDKHLCVICGAPGQNAHHIMERRLWPDGGYYVDNGATLCGEHHLEAEQTILTVDAIVEKLGLAFPMLPPHLYPDEQYDKWGNPILPNGQRVRGELFDDPSVRKVLAPVLGCFTHFIKYPRTYHFPYSPGIGKTDRVATNPLNVDPTLIVITEKMDGENTTLYRDYIHARSIDYKSHISRDWVKNYWAKMAYNIPDGWRVCGENVYAKHSIEYKDLRSYFLAYSIWNEKNECLSNQEFLEWCEILDLHTVPLLYLGPYNEILTKDIAHSVVARGGEGIVARCARSFPYSQFKDAVAKYVRANHVQTHGGWFRQSVVSNTLKI